MRVLLDECLPRRLKAALIGHQVTTVPEMGWAGTKNGDLLALAADHFAVFVTVDQKLTVQWRLSDPESTLTVVVLVARSNRLEMLRPLVPNLLLALERIRPSEIVRVGL